VSIAKGKQTQTLVGALPSRAPVFLCQQGRERAFLGLLLVQGSMSSMSGVSGAIKRKAERTQYPSVPRARAWRTVGAAAWDRNTFAVETAHRSKVVSGAPAGSDEM
jgi:hypothetical protein